MASAPEPGTTSAYSNSAHLNYKQVKNSAPKPSSGQPCECVAGVMSLPQVSQVTEKTLLKDLLGDMH